MTWWNAARNFFRHGFAMREQKPREEELRIFRDAARRAGPFAFPLLVLVEGLRPAAFLLSSVLTGLEPVGELFISHETYRKFSSFLTKRENLNAFSSCLEEEILRASQKLP